MAEKSITEINAELADLIKDRLAVRRGNTLGQKLKILGRRLPRRLRRDAKYLADTEDRLANPRLRHQMDIAEVKAAARRLSSYLSEIDPWDRLKGQVLSHSAVIVFNLILVLVIGLVILNWRGLL